jgi:pyocin large subunit-like protein
LRSNWGEPATLADHFARHGADFAARNAEDYARFARDFGERARRGELLVKVDDDGTQRVFEARTGTFGAYNDDWTTKTFFKPRSRDYFARQPGRLVNPAKH